MFLLCTEHCYYEHEELYDKGIFERADFERLAAILARLKGKFLLSINDAPEIRQTFAGFHRCRLSHTYTFRARKPIHELLIANFPLPRRA